MATTRVFQSGNSLAVRIPKNFHIEGPEVEIFQRNDELVIREIPRNLSKAFYLLQALSDCFDEPREDSLPQQREDF